MSKLSKNIVYNLFGQGLVLIISFAAVKLIFNKLGGEALGIIYFTASMNAVLTSVLEGGVSATIVREVSAHFGSDKNYIKKLTRTFSFFYWAIYALSAAVIFFMAPFFVHHWIHLSTMSSDAAIGIVRVLGIASITVLPRSFYSSLIYGLQKMEFNNLINVSVTGLQQLGAFLILIYGGGLLSVIYWFAAAYIFQMVVYLLVSAHFFSFSFLVPKVSLDVIKRNFKFIFSTALISIFATINTEADKLVVSKFLPIATLGYYSFAYSGVSQGAILSGAVSQAAYPSLSSLAKAGDKDALFAQYRKLQDFVCFITLPIFAAVPFVIIPLFSYLFSDNIAHSLLLPATFLSLGFYINGTISIPYIFSLSVGKPEIAAKTNFYALFMVLPVIALLIYFFGLNGAGFSWIFYNAFSYIYAIPRICRECLNIKTVSWYFHILKIIVLTILTYGMAWLILSLINNYSIFALVLSYLIASALFFLCSYFLIIKELKETIFNYLNLILKMRK